MIRFEIYLKRIDWKVTVMYAVTCYNLEALEEVLEDAGASDHTIDKALGLIEARRLNQGFTYSNMERRSSVMVVALASSAEQYANSIAHERGHLVAQIADKLGMDLRGEEPCYLAGDLAQQMHAIDSMLVCPKCMWRLKAEMIE